MIHMKQIKLAVHEALYAVLGSAFYEKCMVFKTLGYWPDFKAPQSFNEKVCTYKLFRAPPDAYIIADKVRVRNVVEQQIGPQYLTKLYYAGHNPDEISWPSLPQTFVAKGNHGSGDDYMMMVDDKRDLDEAIFKKSMHRILKQRFGKTLNEHWYLGIEPQIMIEERLQCAGHQVPPDYKFFVFNGKVAMVFVATGRYGTLGLSFYTPEWDKLDFSINYPIGPDIPKPENLRRMIDLAEKLAAPYEALRVDLYCLDDDRIVFGELTLAHGSGRYPFVPDKSYDFAAGRFWNIPDQEKSAIIGV